MHKDSIAIGVAPAGREAPHFVGTVAPQWSALSKTLGRLGRAKELQIVYEAGPCGYTLARELRSHGYACEVVAPAKIARRPGDRIKTDRRDALLLARTARAGELVNVMIPDERDEALRDLSRAREDAVRARLKARQQLKALLLRHGHRYTGKSSWTAAHERYLADLSKRQHGYSERSVLEVHRRLPVPIAGGVALPGHGSAMKLYSVVKLYVRSSRGASCSPRVRWPT